MNYSCKIEVWISRRRLRYCMVGMPIPLKRYEPWCGEFPKGRELAATFRRSTPNAREPRFSGSECSPANAALRSREPSADTAGLESFGAGLPIVGLLK